MIKFKTTKKEIKNNYSKIIKIGYCQAQNLLRDQEPFAYKAGMLGWDCDFYDINGVCVCTGYKAFGNVDYDNNELRELEKKARDIDYRLSYEAKKEIISEMLDSWVNKVVEGK